MSDEQVVTESGLRTRRALLAGAGAVGASVVLGACGTDTTSTPYADPPAAGNDPTGAANGGSTGGGSGLAKTSDIPVGGGSIVKSENVVVTQPADGQFKCFSAVCTHQGCPVTSVDGGTINCTCHGSKFSIKDGSVKSGPATRGLEEKSITVDGGNITFA